MLDGIKIFSDTLLSAKEWAEKTGINLKGEFNIHDYDQVEEKDMRRNYTVRRYFGKHKSMTIKCKEIQKHDELKTNITVYGSLHKSFTNGRNDTAIKWKEVTLEAYSILEKLNISPRRAKIQNLEFGVNIPFETHINHTLLNQLLSHKTTPFTPMPTSPNFDPIGYEANHTHYKLKIYDKSKQMGLKQDILRIELKYSKMQELNKIGVYGIPDIEKKEVQKKLEELILRIPNNLLVYDVGEDTLKKLNQKEKHFAEIAKYPTYWEELHANGVQQYYQKKRELKRLNSLNNNSIINLISEGIFQGIHELSN